MNRWEVQFNAGAIPVTVTCPSATDAIRVAASTVRREANLIVSQEEMRVPWRIRWLGAVSGAAASVPPPVAQEEAEPAPVRKATWPCSVCGQRFGIAETAAHVHRDDPRSVYYEPPPTAALENALAGKPVATP